MGRFFGLLPLLSSALLLASVAAQEAEPPPPPPPFPPDPEFKDRLEKMPPGERDRFLKNFKRWEEMSEAETCCGFGGTFSLKNPDVSIAMATDKARHVRSTDAEYLVAGDHACLMNIGGVLHRGRSGVKTIHLAEILASTEEAAA